jgi:hypothetical protein
MTELSCELVVGRTGADTPLEEVSDGEPGLAGQSVAPQTRSVRQHPPLREAGQDLKAVGQVAVVFGLLLVGESGGVVDGSWEAVG